MSIERLAQSETFYPGYEEAHSDITAVAFGIRRFSDGQWYDFDDSTFKTSGWTTKQQALAEDDNGLWTYDTGWVIPDSDAVYQLQWKLTDGTGVYYELGPKIIVNSSLLDALATGVQLSAQGKLDVNAECDTALSDYGANTTVPDAAGVAATPAEVATALTNIHLDHLFAADYDPASKPGVATALLNELIENDGGVSRYTANALEQASGSGLSAQETRDAMKLAPTGGAPAAGSVDLHLDDILTDTGTTLETHFTDIKGGTFAGATDSLEAIRDRGDDAWVTGGGGSISDILNVQPLIPNAIDLADTATVRASLGLTNMLDDLPSMAEIDPGIITIDRKAIGGTSWVNVVNAVACSELAGLVYYDEVFDAGAGYAAGDMIRIIFKSQKITVAANDYEITGTDGWVFHTYIREVMRGTNSAYTGTPPTEVAIAEKVWDVLASGHLAAGSFGELAALMAGLAQQNQYLDQTVYDAADRLLSGRLRLYNNAGSVGSSSNLLATYLITSIWSGSVLSSYKVVKQ